jgi:hypothetical protein
MGQTLLVMGAMVLLSIAVLSANRIILDRTNSGYQTQAIFAAVPIAEAKLDEIRRKAFDENSINKRIYVASNFTSSSLLGRDAGETTTFDYDDIDDYNRDSVKVSTPVLDNFWVVSRIQYVSESNPDQVSSSPTFFKRITVTVYHYSMQFPVTMSFLYVYRRFE